MVAGFSVFGRSHMALGANPKRHFSAQVFYIGYYLNLEPSYCLPAFLVANVWLKTPNLCRKLCQSKDILVHFA